MQIKSWGKNNNRPCYFQLEINGKRAVRAGRGFTLFISSKDMNDIKFTKLLEDSVVLIDCNTEAVKHEIKK